MMFCKHKDISSALFICFEAGGTDTVGARSALDASQWISALRCVLPTPSATPLRMIPAVNQLPATEARAESPAYLTWMSETPTG